jgi:hypothetical protein
MNITGETAAGVTVDNTSVLVTHIFPADGSATGVRVLNASGEAQKAQLRVPGQGHRVLKADLDGNAMQDAVPLPLAPDGGYICPLRPWEIATFRVEL